jgi:uncharacterized protein YjiS (DUF1127 family)
MLVALLASVRRWFLYRQTVRELSNLSERQLAEIGINPSDIRHVAHKAVYGAA